MSAHLPFLCARRLGPPVFPDRFRRILESEPVILSVVSSLAALVLSLTAGVSPGLSLGLLTAVTRSVPMLLRRSAMLRGVPLTLPGDGVLLAALWTAVALATLELTARLVTALLAVLLVLSCSASLPGLVSGTVLFATVRAPSLLSPLRVLGAASTVSRLIAVMASTILLVLPARLLRLSASLLLVLTCLLLVLAGLLLVLAGLLLVLAGLPVMLFALLMLGILLVPLPGLWLSTPGLLLPGARRLLLLRFAPLTVRRLLVAVVPVLTVLLAASIASVLVIHCWWDELRSVTLPSRRGSNGNATPYSRGSGKNGGKRSPTARRYTRLSPSKPAVTDRRPTKSAVTPDRSPPLRA